MFQDWSFNFQICHICINDLHTAYEFKLQCQSSYLYLKNKGELSVTNDYEDNHSDVEGDSSRNSCNTPQNLTELNQEINKTLKTEHVIKHNNEKDCRVIYDTKINSRDNIKLSENGEYLGYNNLYNGRSQDKNNSSCVFCLKRNTIKTKKMFHDLYL